jgi:hypothetical protein
MALGSTQPLTEMSTRNLLGGKKWPAHRADNLAAICELIVLKMWVPQPLATLRVSTACIGITLPFYGTWKSPNPYIRNITHNSFKLYLSHCPSTALRRKSENWSYKNSV